MLFLISLLNIVIPLLYFVLFCLYFLDFYYDKRDLVFIKKTLLKSTVVMHLIYILLRTFEYNHAPITNKFELFTSISFTIALSYLIIEWATKERITGFFILIFSFVFQLFSSIFVYDTYVVKDVLRNPLLGIHVISALLGHSSLIISAVYGFLFIILYNRIKQRNFGTYFNKLPSLETLESMSFKALFYGYLVLSVSLLIGAVWLPFAFPDFKHLDPKLLSSLVIWIVYTIGIISKRLFNWYGKKVIYFSIFGFFVLIISMLTTLVFKSSFHNFR